MGWQFPSIRFSDRARDCFVYTRNRVCAKPETELVVVPPTRLLFYY